MLLNISRSTHLLFTVICCDCNGVGFTKCLFYDWIEIFGELQKTAKAFCVNTVFLEQRPSYRSLNVFCELYKNENTVDDCV